MLVLTRIKQALNSLNYQQVFALCFLVVLLVATIQPIGPNDVSRYLNILAVADGKGLSIDQQLTRMDTMDKIIIKGHFYSDKPPLFALTFVPIFSLAKICGISIYNPYLYKLALALVLGLFFAWAMAAFYREYAERFPLYRWLILALIFATPYYVFNRVLMSHALVASLLYLAFYFLRRKTGASWLILAGLFSGLAVAYDHGAVFLLLAFLLYLFLAGRLRALIPFLLAASLPLAAHLLVVYQMSGSLLPLNMQPELFNYPGSVFSDGRATGGWKHPDLFSFAGYLLALLFIFPFGYHSKGLFLTAPVLLFAVIQLFRSAWGGEKEGRALLVGILLLFFYYALSSNNLAGGDYTVRWFIIFMPLLFPYAVQFYTFSGQQKNIKGWFIFTLVISLLISFLYSFVSWLGGVTPLF